MADLLTAEERTALQAPYGADRSGGAREVRRAVFPDANQIDPERTAALVLAIKSWAERLLKELSMQLRVSCSPCAVYQQTVSRGMLPVAAEESFWGIVEGHPEAVILLALPRSFAAALCERVFGAPMQAIVERELTAAEVKLLRELACGWFSLFAHAWKEHTVRLCRSSEEERIAGDDPTAEWIRFTSDLACGPVQGAISVTMAPSTSRQLLGESVSPGGGRSSPGQVAGLLGEVPLELRAVLGHAEFTLDELASLRIGDVVALGRRTEDPVDVTIDDLPFCMARVGVNGHRVALEVISDLTQEPKDGR
jgi:flagellar motor switch protein FliM